MMARAKIQIPIITIALSIVLGSCAPTLKPHLVQRDPPPVEMTDCQEEPPFPEAGFPSEAARYAWSASAIFSGRECRAKLHALKAWALNQPVSP